MESIFSLIKERLRDPLEVMESVGRCIYCGSQRHSKQRDQLSDEHVIAYSIGGKILLPNSSCAHCERITGSTERWFARKLLGASRAVAGFPTRRQSERDQTIFMEVIRQGIYSLEEINIDELPFIVTLPNFQLAGIFFNKKPSVNFPKGEIKVGLITTKPNSLFHQSMKIPFDYNPTNMCRVLAKIAHSYVSGKIGLNKFIPLLLPSIFGTSDAYTYFVGGSRRPGITVRNELHTLEAFQWNIRGCIYYVVRIQMFACLGMPAYDVVAGIVSD